MTATSTGLDRVEKRKGRWETTWQELKKPRVRVAYLFLSPIILGVIVFTVIPFIASFYFSFTKYDVLSSPQWRGLDNYLRLFQSRLFWISLWNSFYYYFGTMPAKLFLGLAMALMLNRAIRGVSFFRMLYYTPVVTAMVAVSVVWLWLYNPNFGLLNVILSKIGLPRQLWLLDPKLAMPSLMMLGVWKWTGSVMVIYLAALQGIPETYYEAASIDGAGSFQQFWHITWPLLKPATFFNLVTMGITSLQVFEQIFVLTAGGPGFSTSTVVYQIYEEAFQKFHMGYASAMAFVLFMIIMTLTLINFKFGDRGVDYY